MHWGVALLQGNSKQAIILISAASYLIEMILQDLLIVPAPKQAVDPSLEKRDIVSQG